jgi:5'-methylthioadenosine phosphorylase
MLGIIGGTGLGEALFGDAGEERHVDTPFGAPSSPIRVVRWGAVDVAVIARHGEGHVLAPTSVPYRANVFALKKLGVTHLLTSGAVGSLREEYRPRDLVVVDQVIDKTTRRASTFFDEGVAAHVELAEPYCPALRARLVDVARSRGVVRADGVTVHQRATYVCMEGPAFSTRAEAHMHRAWGADLVGMTAMPEAKLAREAEMCCALLAFPTDDDCWRPHAEGTTKEALLAEIIGNVKAATANAIALLRATVEDLAAHPPAPCGCQSALALGIWSKPDRVAPATIERLGPLVAKYFAK